jgi:hypothetical protein
VHHAALVRVVQRGGHFLRDARGFLDRQLPLVLQPAAQRLALDEGHGAVVEQVVRGARVEQRQDVRMLQRGGELDLLRIARRR